MIMYNLGMIYNTVTKIEQMIKKMMILIIIYFLCFIHQNFSKKYNYLEILYIYINVKGLIFIF